MCCKLAIACDILGLTSGGAITAYDLKDLQRLLKWHSSKALLPTECIKETSSLVSCSEFLKVHKTTTIFQVDTTIKLSGSILIGIVLQNVGGDRHDNNKHRLLQAFAAFADPCMPTGCIQLRLVEEILVRC